MATNTCHSSSNGERATIQVYEDMGTNMDVEGGTAALVRFPSRSTIHPDRTMPTTTTAANASPVATTPHQQQTPHQRPLQRRVASDMRRVAVAEAKLHTREAGTHGCRAGVADTESLDVTSATELTSALIPSDSSPPMYDLRMPGPSPAGSQSGHGRWMPKLARAALQCSNLCARCP